MPTYPDCVPGLIDCLKRDRQNLPTAFVLLIERLLTDLNMKKVWEKMSRSANKPPDWDIKFAGLVYRTMTEYRPASLEPADRVKLIKKTERLIDNLIAAIDDLEVDVDDELWRTLIRLQLKHVGMILTEEEADVLANAADYPTCRCLDIPAALQALRERVGREKTVPGLLSKPRDKSAKLHHFLFTLNAACEAEGLTITHEGLGIVAEIALGWDLVDADTVKSILKRRRARSN